MRGQPAFILLDRALDHFDGGFPTYMAGLVLVGLLPRHGADIRCRRQELFNHKLAPFLQACSATVVILIASVVLEVLCFFAIRVDEHADRALEFHARFPIPQPEFHAPPVFTALIANAGVSAGLCGRLRARPLY